MIMFQVSYFINIDIFQVFTHHIKFIEEIIASRNGEYQNKQISIEKPATINVGYEKSINKKVF